MCIASNTKINEVLSGEYINSCCNGNCGNGCNGGHPEKAWKFIKRNGICTGGEYNSDEVSINHNTFFFVFIGFYLFKTIQ